MARLKKYLILIFAFLQILSYSQEYLEKKQACNSCNLIISKTVYNKDEEDIKKIIELVRKYISSSDFDYSDWAEKSVIDYRVPDYMLKSTLFYYKKETIQSNLIFIEKKENYWIAKVAFNEIINEVNGGLICIYNFGIKQEKNQFKLFNLLEVSGLQKSTIDGCTFYYENKTDEVVDGVNKMTNFNKKMSDIFGQKVDFRYIDIEDKKKLGNVMGFDFEQYMNIPTKINAFTDITNGIIYASSNNTYYYPHEVVHLYVQKNFHGTYHPWFNEGLATYLGGSLELSLNDHLKKLNIYLNNHPEINLNNTLDYLRIDDVTNYEYTIGGLLCKLMYDKNGYEGIFKLLRAGSKDEDFYNTVEKYFGVKRENLNEFIRKEVAKY